MSAQAQPSGTGSVDVSAACQPDIGAGRVADEPALLELRGATLSRGAAHLVENLNLQIRRGQVWTVLGENGAGKSSLLAAMVDYLPLSAGDVLLLGKPLRQFSSMARARLLSWLPQHEPDTLSVTVLERVMLARHPFVDSFFRDEQNDVDAAEFALADVGLAGYENRFVRQLSGGERRRVSLAACLAQTTPLLLLDEPLSALDLRHQQLLVSRFRQLAEQGAAVVWITHDPNQALIGSTHVLLLMGEGRYVAGSVEEVLNARLLSEAYRTEVRELDADGTRFFYIPPALPRSGAGDAALSDAVSASPSDHSAVAPERPTS